MPRAFKRPAKTFGGGGGGGGAHTNSELPHRQASPDRGKYISRLVHLRLVHFPRRSTNVRLHAASGASTAHSGRPDYPEADTRTTGMDMQTWDTEDGPIVGLACGCAHPYDD